MEILPSGLKIVMTLENYKNGKLEGLRSVYYPSGKIAEEISYLNNMKNGLYKFFRRMELYLNNQFTRTMNTMALPLSKMRKAT
jgi:antitoxin component YwqK of YwqJK toxin-antitoxin module